MVGSKAKYQFWIHTIVGLIAVLIIFFHMRSDFDQSLQKNNDLLWGRKNINDGYLLNFHSLIYKNSRTTTEILYNKFDTIYVQYNANGDLDRVCFVLCGSISFFDESNVTLGVGSNSNSTGRFFNNVNFVSYYIDRSAHKWRIMSDGYVSGMEDLWQVDNCTFLHIGSNDEPAFEFNFQNKRGLAVKRLANDCGYYVIIEGL